MDETCGSPPNKAEAARRTPATDGGRHPSQFRRHVGPEDVLEPVVLHNSRRVEGDEHGRVAGDLFQNVAEDDLRVDLVRHRQLRRRDHPMYVRQVGPRTVHQRRRRDGAPVDPDARDGAAFALDAVDAARHERDARRLRSTHELGGVPSRVDPARAPSMYNAHDVLRQRREGLPCCISMEDVKARGQRVDGVQV